MSFSVDRPGIVISSARFITYNRVIISFPFGIGILLLRWGFGNRFPVDQSDPIAGFCILAM